MDSTVDHDMQDSTMNHTEAAYNSQDDTLELNDASEGYVDENSPEVANVESVMAKGGKRKPLQQQVVAAQTRKKQKSPPKAVQSIFDSDSDHVSATSTPAIPLKPKAVKAKKVPVAAAVKHHQQNEEPGNNEEVPAPVAKPAAKKGRPPKGEGAVKPPASTAVKPPASTAVTSKGKGEEKPPATTSVESKAQTRPKKAPAEPKARETAVKPVKIKLNPPKNPLKLSIKVMLKEAMEVINEPRKGVSFKEVKRYLSTTFMYENDTPLKKAVKTRLATGEYVKVKGVGLIGNFKLKPAHPPKRRTKTVESEPTPGTSSAGKKSRKGSKPVNSLTEVKPSKRRKSVNVQAPKVPKSKKMVAEKEAKGKKVTKTKSDPVAKGAKKAPAEGTKKTSARIKATRSNT